MKKIRSFLTLVTFSCLVASVGCHQTLAPGGVYQGDMFLYDAHATIDETHSLIQMFIDWEKNNRQALAQWPEIRAAADKLYTDGPQYFSTAMSAINAYKAHPGDATKQTLQLALDELQSLSQSVTTYLAAHKNLAPPPVNSATNRPAAFLFPPRVAFVR